MKKQIHQWRLVWRATLRDFRDRYARVVEDPIFVLGNQKSGTTVIAASLGNALQAEVSLDLARQVDNPTFQDVYLGHLSLPEFVAQNRLEFSRPIIKEAVLTPLYFELNQRFPKARYVFIVRDPCTNIRSILQRLKLPGDQVDLKAEQWRDISKAWRCVLKNEGLGLEDGSYIETLARRWIHFLEIYRQSSSRMILCRYEDFLANKETVIRDLARRLGAMNPQVDPALLNRQFQPKGDHSQSLVEFFGIDNLAKIESICQPGREFFDH